MFDQRPIIDALLKPGAYSRNPGEIELLQTHISFVVLTKKYVYKIKKAVNFGFLDFSTIDKRKLFCEKELTLNRRLCPKIYLAVIPITKGTKIKVNGKGETIEYALKMKRLPQEDIMTLLLKEDKVSKKTINNLAKKIAAFHLKADSNSEIDEFGTPKIIKMNWDENFVQTKKYINQTISENQFQTIKTKIYVFIKKNISFIENRIAERRIRDCHGDLHSGNIFITNQICIFDAIEFNDRFRYSDVVADVAFLAMDLEYQKKPELADYFIDKYIQYSKDYCIPTLLPFYKCYRAYVRGKVVSFSLDDKNISFEEKEKAVKEAREYFKLSYEYSKML